MTTPVQIDRAQYYEGLTTQEMMQEVRRWLGVAPTDTNRYSDDSVIQGLNYGQNRFAKLTGFLLMPTIITCVANQMHYRLPYNALKVMAARYYTGSSKTDYYELEIKRSMKQVQRLDSTMRGSVGTPEYLFPTYRAGNVPIIGLNPAPSVNGTTWTGTPYGVMTSATGFTNVGNITGQHKAGYPNSAFLVDSEGRNFTTLGAMVGYPVFNVTDGSSGLITAIGDADATNDKISVTLAGGTDDDWDEGDSFQIPMSEYGVVMDATGEETYTFTSFLGTIYEIAGNTGNLVLDIGRKPLPLSSSLLTMFSEVPADCHEAIIAFAVYWLGRSAHKGVTQKEKSEEGLAVFNGYVQEFNNEDQTVEETDAEVEDRMSFYME